MEYKKKLIIAAVMLLTVIGIIGYYLYASLTFKPQWYAQKEIDSAYVVAADAPQVKEEIKRIEHRLNTEGKARIADSALTHAMIFQVKRRMDLDVGGMIKAAHWTPADTAVEMEIVVDLTKMPREELSERAGKIFDRALKLTGGAILDNIYIKAQLPAHKPGAPIRIDPKSKVSIGKLAFTFEQLEKRTGIRCQELLEKLGWFDFQQTDEGLVLIK